MPIAVPRPRSLAASVGGLLVLVVACSSGQSQAPPAPPQQLPCEVTLQQDCCGAASNTKCVGDFGSAERCSNWPTGSKVLVYPTACGGYTTVAVKLPSNTYTQFFLYSSGTLSVIADDAQVNSQGAVEIECGAGPSGFTLPGACSVEWLDATKGAACATGTSTPASVCQ